MDRARSRRLILAAAVLGLILRLAFGFFYWTDKPLTHDEREYLTLAQSLAEGRGFTLSRRARRRHGAAVRTRTGIPGIPVPARRGRRDTSAPGRDQGGAVDARRPRRAG